MFKFFKNQNKGWKNALYALIVGAILILFIFAIINIKPIFSYANGVIGAMSAFIYGFILAFLCNPIYKKIHKYVFKFIESKKPHPKLRIFCSIVVTYLIIAGIIALIVFAIIPDIKEDIATLTPETITSYAENLILYATQFLEKMGVSDPEDTLTELIGAAFEALNITTVEPDASSGALEVIYKTLISYATGMIANLGPQIFQIIIGFILSFYFLIYKDSIFVKCKRILCALFPEKAYNRIIHFAKYTNDTFGKYITGTICDAVLVGCVVTLVLSIFKFPYPAIIGLVCGVTNVIPFFGPFLGAIPSGILIFVNLEPGEGSDMDSLTYKFIGVCIFALIILVIQQIDGNIIAPHILGESTGLTPIAVIAAITFCGHVFGFIGMIIGVPACAVIAYMFNCFIESKLKKKKLPTSIECYDLGIDVHNTDFTKIYAENDFTQEIDLKQMTDTFSNTSSTVTVNVPIKITKIDPNNDSPDDNQ